MMGEVQTPFAGTAVASFLLVCAMLSGQIVSCEDTYSAYVALSFDCGSYNAPVKVGDDTFEVQLDTGSSNFAVASKDCNNCSVSGSYTGPYSKNDEFFVTYGTGAGLLARAQNTFKVGSLEAQNINFAVFVSNLYDGNQPFFPVGGACKNMYAGIWGLSVKSLAFPSSNPIIPVFDDLVSEDKIPDIFSFHLCPSDANTPKPEGIMGGFFMGGYPESHLASKITWTPIQRDIQDGYYAKMEQVMIGSKPVTEPLAPYALLDTGTSGLALSPESAQNSFINDLFLAMGDLENVDICQYLTLFEGTIGISKSIFGKKDYDKSLSVTFQFANDSSVSLSAESLLTSQDGSLYLTGFAMCGSFCGHDTLMDCGDLILGDPAFWDNIVVFDRENSRLGFASATTSGSTDCTSPASGKSGSLSAGQTFGIVLAALGGLGIILFAGFVVSTGHLGGEDWRFNYSKGEQAAGVQNADLQSSAEYMAFEETVENDSEL